MIEVIAAIEQRHVLHLVRIGHSRVQWIRKGQQLTRRLYRKMQAPVREGAAQIVVVAAEVVAPVEWVAGRTDAPAIVSPDSDGHKDHYGPLRHSPKLGLRHPRIVAS